MPASAPIPASEPTDADLVGRCLAGERDAFGLIVARHQSLLCALAYSAVGNLAQSEDLAQETLVTAWKQLGDLREPEKLRAWLCGIVRNLAQNARRRQDREPIHFAEPLDSTHELSAPGLTPAAHAIQRDEEAILWREMEQIPEIYREPLILFYRQHQSIEHVAVALDLTEDAVKMRLSRGRKLLQEQVLAFVEGTLARTNPSPTFTSDVLAALPVASASLTKSALAATAVKGAAPAKATGFGGLLGAIVWPMAALLGGLRMAIYTDLQAPYPPSPQERRKPASLLLEILFWLAATYGLWWMSQRSPDEEAKTALLIFPVGGGLTVILSILAQRSIRRIPQFSFRLGAHVTAVASSFAALWVVASLYWFSVCFGYCAAILGLYAGLGKRLGLNSPQKWNITLAGLSSVFFALLSVETRSGSPLWIGHRIPSLVWPTVVMAFALNYIFRHHIDEAAGPAVRKETP